MESPAFDHLDCGVDEGGGGRILNFSFSFGVWNRPWPNLELVSMKWVMVRCCCWGSAAGELLEEVEEEEEGAAVVAFASLILRVSARNHGLTERSMMLQSVWRTITNLGRKRPKTAIYQNPPPFFWISSSWGAHLLSLFSFLYPSKWWFSSFICFFLKLIRRGSLSAPQSTNKRSGESRGKRTTETAFLALPYDSSCGGAANGLIWSCFCIQVSVVWGIERKSWRDCLFAERWSRSSWSLQRRWTTF